MNEAKLKELMKRDNADVVIAVSPENVLYTSGVDIWTQRIIKERLAFTIYTQKEEPIILVCNIEETLVKDHSFIKNVQAYVEFKENPVTKLVSILKELGLEKSTIAVEKEYLAMEYAEELTKAMPQAAFIDSSNILREVRIDKTEKGIETLRYAATSTPEVIEDVFRNSKIGDTEKEISIRMLQGLISKGALPEYNVLGSGDRSVILHADPSNNPIKTGDVMRTDFSGKFGGYYSDVARTVFVGQPSNKQEKIFTSLMEIHRALIDHARVGVKFSEIYNLCKKLFIEKDLEFTLPHVGHSIGLNLHEKPIIHAFNDDVLEENMVLNIEPLYIDEESMDGYHVEDLILVTKEGPEILTGSDLNSSPIIIE